MVTGDAAPTYPKRPSHFAHKFCRLLAKATIANEMGSDVCWMLAVIAHTEDAKQYRGPVLFHNGQLMSFCGFKSEDVLARCRKTAVDAGWLHYLKGSRTVAPRYWVLVPSHMLGKDDMPSDERPDKYEIGESAESDSPYPKNAVVRPVNHPVDRQSIASQSPGRSSEPSSLHLNLHQQRTPPLPPAEPGGEKELLRNELRKAVAEVSGRDPISGNTKIARAVGKLLRASPPYTAAEVREFGKRFWELCPYAKEQKRARPTPKEIAAEIGLIRAGPLPGVAVDHAAKVLATRQQHADTRSEEEKAAVVALLAKNKPESVTQLLGEIATTFAAPK